MCMVLLIQLSILITTGTSSVVPNVTATYPVTANVTMTTYTSGLNVSITTPVNPSSESNDHGKGNFSSETQFTVGIAI